MNYKIRELKLEDLEDDKGFFSTLANLSEAPLLSEEKRVKIFRQCQKNKIIYIAESNQGQIVGTTSLMLDYKFSRQGAVAGHIEDVITRKGYERMGIGKNLVRKVLEKARELDCYKVILSSSNKVAPFYRKLGFNDFELTLRIDL